MKIEEGVVEFDGHETYYRITGPRSGRPLVVAHGGPGATHNYLLSLTDLVRPDRPVIHYDQLGNGKSTHLPEKPPEYWTVELFAAELANLLRKLDIADYDLFGQSWGGMLAAEHAVRQPAGLNKLVIANSPASMSLWITAATELRARLPQQVQEVLTAHEEAGTTDAPEYRSATDEFYRRHMCRIDPMPPEVKRTFDWMDTDQTVYHTMNGPTEFHVIGTMRTWSVIDRLPRITVPTLVINGAHDEATDDTVRPYVEHIPDARWLRFPDSSHLPHVEERESFMTAVDDFLRQS